MPEQLNLKWSVGLVILRVRGIPENGTPVSKHVVVILIVNYVTLYIIKLIVGQYIE